MMMMMKRTRSLMTTKRTRNQSRSPQLSASSPAVEAKSFFKYLKQHRIATRKKKRRNSGPLEMSNGQTS